MTPEEIVNAIQKTPAKRVVITGGEPFLHDLTALTRSLKGAGYLVHCETSGTCLLTGDWDWVCFSPKKFKAPLPVWYQIADELKVIVYQNHDLEWGVAHSLRCRPEVKLFFQPEWNSVHKLPGIVEFVKSHPDWRISLQTHKYLQIP
jgi:organic radical activating enzyme